MREPVETTTPRRLLLATDLTSRSDRALDRAAQLARAWDAELHIVHVASDSPGPPAGVDETWYRRRHPTPKREAMRVMARDVPAAEWGAVVHIEEGAAPGPAIIAVAERERCDLIVLGEARRRLAGSLIESTTEYVMRQSPASVLAVRDRAKGMYRNLLVGTDFTDEAQQALVVAARLFAEATITLMYAHAMPYAYLLDDVPESEEELARLREQVATADLPGTRKATIHCSVQAGPPAMMLRRHVIDNRTDLTVIGAHPRGMLFDVIVGNSRRIADAVPGDLLMVRAVRSAG